MVLTEWTDWLIDFHSIDKNTMIFNGTKILQNNIFCLGGLSFNICFYQLLALWNATRMCSKSPTKTLELEKKNKTLPRRQKSNYGDSSDRRQPGRASNQPQTAILPHTKSSSLISPLISPSSDTPPPPLNLKIAAAASWRSDLLSFRGYWGWSVPRSADPPRAVEVWRLWQRALSGNTCPSADGKTNVDICHLQDPIPQSLMHYKFDGLLCKITVSKHKFAS